jgi:hypothetical protein
MQLQDRQYATNLTGGFPSGRWRIYTTVANTVFTSYWDLGRRPEQGDGRPLDQLEH